MKTFFDLEDDEQDKPVAPASDFQKLRDEIAAIKVGDQEGDGADITVGDQQTDNSPVYDKVDPPPAEPKAGPAAAKPAIDDELMNAQARARKAERRANLGRAGSEFIAAFGGYKPDQSYWDNAEKQGQQGVTDLKELRASSAEKQKTAVATARNDASSPESQTARNAVIPILGKEYVDMLKKQGAWDSLTYNDIQSGKVFEAIKLKEELEGRRATAAATHKAKLEGDQRDSLALGDLIKRTYPDQDQKFVDDLTLEGKKKLLADLQDRRRIEETNTRAKNSLNETSRGHDIAAEGLGLRTNQFERDKGRATVSGWESDHPLQDKQAEEFQQQVAGREQIHKLTKEAKQLALSGLDLNPNSPKMTRLRQLMAALYPTVVKSGGYGSLTQGHQHLLDQATGGDPGTFANILKNEVTPERLPAMLDALAEEADMSVESSAKALGMHRPAAGAPSGTGTVTVRRKSDNKTITLPREKASKYLADTKNFEEVRK